MAKKIAAPAAPPVIEQKRTHVPVGKVSVKLGTPRSLVPSYLVKAGKETNVHLAVCAALGIVWEAGGTANPPAKWSAANHDTMAYGSTVLEVLLRRGILPENIENAAVLAWLHLTAMLPTAEEVEAAEDFSDQQTEDSTS